MLNFRLEEKRMLENFVNQINKNAKIAIYGAGNAGSGIKEYIEKSRPDIKILFFVDAYKQGTQDGLKIIGLRDLPAHKSLFDLLVVATRRSAHELIEIFDFNDIPFKMISREIEQYYRVKKYLSAQKQVCEFLETEEDKKLYNMLWETYCGGYYEKIKEYAKTKHGISKYHPVRNYNAQYLEYINKDAIKTIFDAGFCNGIQSLAFKKHFRNLKKLYAFEPMYEKFKDENYDFFIQKENFVKIIPMGLWNESKELEFCENIASKSASRIKGSKGIAERKPNETIIKIKTTTIDETKDIEQTEKIDFIKMDIEGAELPALKGGEKTLLKDRPQLAISIYHSIDDFCSIPLYLHGLLKNYTFKIGHYSYDLCETVLYAIPNELKN